MAFKAPIFSPETHDLSKVFEVLEGQLKAVVAKLKASADEFEPATLEPNESMLLYRILTEHMGLKL